MDWLPIIIVVVPICVYLIVCRIGGIVEDLKIKHKWDKQGYVDEVIAAERTRLEEEYKEMEQSLCSIKIKELEKTEKERKRYDEKSKSLQKTIDYYESEANKYNAAYDNLYKQVISDVLKPLKIDETKKKDFISVLCTERGRKALTEEMSFAEISQIKCKVYSSSGNTYETSLTTCSCLDKKGEKGVCKHMLSLAIQIGALNVNQKEILDEYGDVLSQVWEEREKLKALENEKEREQKKLEKNKKKTEILEKATKEADKGLKSLITQKCDAYPQFAAMYADMYTYYYDLAAQMLREKPHPAMGEAFRIEELREHTKEYIAAQKVAEYKLGYIRQIYPGVDVLLNGGFDETNAPPLLPNDKKNPRG